MERTVEMETKEMEEAVKRNTDCVYFLASPLTCKKGSNCEFRHSEMARLNPRECWYWLNGNCLNPTCAFRHPPIEGYPGPPSASMPYTSAPATKSCVPCYFYFNAFCVKGDQCPFMHDVLPSQKVLKPACDDASRVHPMDNKTSTVSDTGPASVEVPANPLECTLQVIEGTNSQEVPHHPNRGSLAEELGSSPESSVPECEDPDSKSPEHPSPLADYSNGRVHFYSDQSSEELVNEYSERDEWLESSPGFDVLVDNGLEQFAYEDDAEYLLARERESSGLHSHLYRYDFEDSESYDPLNLPDVGYQYDQSSYNAYDHIDDIHEPEHFHRLPEIPRKRMLEPTPHLNRRLPHWEHRLDVRGGVDLRNHLRKRRRLDSSRLSQGSLRHCLSRTRARSRERPMRPMPHGRLASKVGRNSILSSHCELSGLNDHHRQHRSRYSQSGRCAWPRREEGRSRHGKASLRLSSEVVKSSVENEVKPTQQTSAGFTGPKSLAQIKEEKTKAKVEGGSSQYQRRARDTNFEGPRPLSELLTRKRSSLLSNVSTSSHANGKAYHGTGDSQDGQYVSEFIDDDDADEDDEFRERLAHILEH